MAAHRYLRVTAILLGALALMPIAALAKGESPLLARLPTVERVTLDYARDGTQRGAACKVLADALKSLSTSGSNFNVGIGPEPERYRQYTKCRAAAINAAAGDGRDVGAFSRTLDDTARNPAFQRQVARRYLSAADYAHWEEFQQVQWQMADDFDAGMRYFALVALVPYLFMFFGAAFLVHRALRPWRYDETTGQLRFGGRMFGIYRNGGVVAQSAASRSSHYVPGSQTVATNQYGHSHVVSSTPGYSYTTLHETIHLIDESGSEHVMRLNDWSISAREGHLIGAIHAIRKGRKTGPYLRIWNFTLDEATSNRAALNKMFGLGFLGWAALAIGIGTAFLLAGGIYATVSAGAGTAAASSAVLIVLSPPIAIVIATVIHMRVRNRRMERFNQEVAAPIRALAAREARAAADRTLGPVSRAD